MIEKSSKYHIKNNHHLARIFQNYQTHFQDAKKKVLYKSKNLRLKAFKNQVVFEIYFLALKLNYSIAL